MNIKRKLNKKEKQILPVSGYFFNNFYSFIQETYSILSLQQDTSNITKLINITLVFANKTGTIRNIRHIQITNIASDSENKIKDLSDKILDIHNNPCDYFNDLTITEPILIQLFISHLSFNDLDKKCYYRYSDCEMSNNIENIIMCEGHSLMNESALGIIRLDKNNKLIKEKPTMLIGVGELAKKILESKFL